MPINLGRRRLTPRALPRLPSHRNLRAYWIVSAAITNANQREGVVHAGLLGRAGGVGTA